MSTPPDGEHAALQEQLRLLSAQHKDVLVPAADLIALLDYIKELEETVYYAWERCMGEDL